MYKETNFDLRFESYKWNSYWFVIISLTPCDKQDRRKICYEIRYSFFFHNWKRLHCYKEYKNKLNQFLIDISCPVVDIWIFLIKHFVGFNPISRVTAMDMAYFGKKESDILQIFDFPKHFSQQIVSLISGKKNVTVTDNIM